MRNAQRLLSILNYMGPILCFLNGNNNSDEIYNLIHGENKKKQRNK